MADKTNKQHTVPRCYLKAFGDRSGQLSVYDKATGKAFRANVNDVAQRRCFYDISREHLALGDNEDYDEQFLEHTLAEREGVISRALAAFLEDVDKEGIINQDHRFALAYFMALQSVRTPFVRTLLNEMRSRAMEHVAATEGQECVTPGKPVFEQLKVPDSGWAQIQAAVMLDPVASAQLMDTLVERIWCIGINKTSHPLYTSDNPVVRYNDDPQPGMGYGFGSRNSEVMLPLSSEIILMLWDGKAYPELAKYEGKRFVLTEQNVTFFNWLQVSSSERQVFSATSDFSFAEELCNERPHLRDPHRQQVWIN